MVNFLRGTSHERPLVSKLSETDKRYPFEEQAQYEQNSGRQHESPAESYTSSSHWGQWDQHGQRDAQENIGKGIQHTATSNGECPASWNVKPAWQWFGKEQYKRLNETWRWELLSMCPKVSSRSLVLWLQGGSISKDSEQRRNGCTQPSWFFNRKLPFVTATLHHSLYKFSGSLAIMVKWNFVKNMDGAVSCVYSVQEY